MATLRDKQDTWVRMLLDTFPVYRDKKRFRVSHHEHDTWHFWPCEHKEPYWTRSILTNEVVFDLDMSDWHQIKNAYEKLQTTLDALGFPYLLAFTGGKSCHLHVFLDSSVDGVWSQAEVDQIKERDVDIWFWIRECFVDLILERADLKSQTIKLDWGKIRWAITSKGSMIRDFGTPRPDGRFKTLLMQIPDERPAAAEPVFPDMVPIAKVWTGKFGEHLHRRVMAKLKEFVQGESKEHGLVAKLPNQNPVDWPCIKERLEVGAPPTLRYTWSKAIALALHDNGWPDDDVRKVVRGFVEKCEGADDPKLRSYPDDALRFAKSCIKVDKHFSCAFQRQELDACSDDRKKDCARWKVVKEVAVNESETKKRGRPKKELDRADFPKMTNENWGEIKSLKPDEVPEMIAKPQIEFEDGSIAMEIRKDNHAAFALYDGHEIQIVGDILVAGRKIVDKIELADTIYLPVWDELFSDPIKGVQLPGLPEEYGSEKELFEALEQFALRYFDPVDTEGREQLGLMILYIMRTGFMGHPAISFWEILNPRGGSEGGKGRKGIVLYLLACRGIIQGHPTIGTIHRIAERWQPTLVIDEADIADSSETADLVCFYNCRAVGSPFMRRAHSSDKIEISEVFGPTMLMTRKGFKDDGLESRCFSMVAKASDKLGETIPYSEPPEMRVEAQRLRNKLLMFWLKRRRDYTIDPFGKEIDIDSSGKKIGNRAKMTPRYVNAVINSWSIAKMVGKTEMLCRMAIAASVGLIEQRSTTLAGKIVNVLYEEGIAGRLCLRNDLNDSLPGYRSMEILKGAGRDEARLTLTFRQLIELCTAKGIMGKEDKPLSWTVVGLVLNELEMKRWKERVGERLERVIYVVPQRLAQLMQKFVADRDEKGLAWLIGPF